MEIVILNAKWKESKSHQNLCTKTFTYTKKFDVHEIATVNLSKIYFLKNAKKTCKPNNRDLNRDWIKVDSQFENLNSKINQNFSTGYLPMDCTCHEFFHKQKEGSH